MIMVFRPVPTAKPSGIFSQWVVVLIKYEALIRLERYIMMRQCELLSISTGFTQ